MELGNWSLNGTHELVGDRQEVRVEDALLHVALEHEFLSAGAVGGQHELHVLGIGAHVVQPAAEEAVQLRGAWKHASLGLCRAQLLFHIHGGGVRAKLPTKFSFYS